MSGYLTRWRNSCREFRAAYLGIAVLVLLLSGYLAWGPKPWDSGLTTALEAGDEPHISHYVVSGLWAAAGIVIGIAVLIALAGPWLIRPLPEEMPAPPTIQGNPRSRRLFWILLAAAAVLSGIIQAPRLNDNLWGDEEYTAKRFVAGYYRRDADDQLELKKPEWIWTVWDFRRGPTNHQLFSILSRSSHSLYQPSSNPKHLYFSEALIRLPSYVASLGSIFAVGWLAALLGGQRAGILAGFFLALHPWFIRYGPEARGYGLLMLLLTLSLVFLYKALTGGRWRHWLAFGLMEFLAFISFLGSLHFIVLLNLVGLLIVLFAQRNKEARAPQFGRYFVANCLAGCLVIIMLLPVVELTKKWLERTTEAAAFGTPPDLHWMIDAACEIATGLPWHTWDSDNPLAIHLADKPLLLTVPLLCLTALLLALGMLQMWAGSASRRLLMLAMVLPAPFMVLNAVFGGSFLFSWYLLVALPPFVVLTALGMEWLAERFRSDRRRTVAFVTMAVLFLGLLVVTTGDRVQLLRSRSIEPLYQSVALTRDILNPADPAIDEGVITVGFSMWSQAYDPAARMLHSAPELQSALDQARAEGKELYANFGQYALAKQNVPDIMAMIEDETLFEQVAVLPGLWQPCTRWVYRARLEKD